MSSRDQRILDTLDHLIIKAPELGICQAVLINLKNDILFVMGQRDGMEEAMKYARI